MKDKLKRHFTIGAPDFTTTIKYTLPVGFVVGLIAGAVYLENTL